MTTCKVFHIFVVEDNPADVYLLKQARRHAGPNFELTVIDHGAEALDLVSNPAKLAAMPKPDLAILDLNLPGEGGTEILAAMRKNAYLDDVPVAIVTSSSAHLDRTRVETFRIQRFITKPHELAAIL